MARATKSQKEDARGVALALAGYRWTKLPYREGYNDGSKYCCGLWRWLGGSPLLGALGLAVCVRDGAYTIDYGHNQHPSRPLYRGGRICPRKQYPTEAGAMEVAERLVLRALRRASPD